MSRFAGIITVVFCALFIGFVGVALAGPPPNGGAPEIDPGVASSAIALLSCGVLMLTTRRRKRGQREEYRKGVGVKKMFFILAIGASLLFSAGAAKAAYMETFDSGSAGWGNDIINSSTLAITTTASSWSATGGNPNGYIYGAVPTQASGTAFYGFDASYTPSEVAKFGNLTGTTLSANFMTSAANLVTAAGSSAVFARFYVGDGSSYYLSTDAVSWNPNNDLTWTLHQVAMNSANFFLYNGSLSFATVIANPTDIGIVFTASQSDIVSSGYILRGMDGSGTTISLDNFGTDPVPLPGTLMLFGPGLFSLGFLVRKRLR
jgi:hypothetical protein